MSRIAIVVPSIRPEEWFKFNEAWDSLFTKHQVYLIRIIDGDNPVVSMFDYKTGGDDVEDNKLYGEYEQLVFNYNSGVRNLGFLYIAKYLKDVKTVISLDDDVRPFNGNDPIQEHLDALNKKVIVHDHWINTYIDYGVRGFPYKGRKFKQVKFSHGIWKNIPDYDAITQLYLDNKEGEFWKGVLPENKYMPICSMNFAFDISVMGSVYQAPMGPKLENDYGLEPYNRFEDIWGGIGIIEDSWKDNWSIVTGYSTIEHIKASNVWVNLRKESLGMELNEELYKWDSEDNWSENPYVALLFKKRKSFKECITQLMG